MVILGIDPGIERTGWGVLEVQGAKNNVKNYGCILTSKETTVAERLEQIYNELIKILNEYKPQALSIEELFFNTNVSSALIVGQARGVIHLAATQHKLPIAIYTPFQVKMAVTGYGRAHKKQVGQMVKTILHLTETPKPDDTADALAIALAHAFSYKMKR